MMKDNGRRVWHCRDRLTEKCSKHNFCRGTICKDYKLTPGSYALTSKEDDKDDGIRIS